MKRTEVTNAEYQACVAAGRCAPPHWYDGTCHVWDGQAWGVGRVSEAFMGPQQPVVCVDWQQARDYARWVGGRLPSEAEWEYAARSGGLNQAYPWGDEPADCGRAVMDDGGPGCGEARAFGVCSRSPAGDTAQGLCDMAGNAWEWVEDVYVASYDGAPGDGSARVEGGANRVARGGGWDYTAGFLRAAHRNDGQPRGRDTNAGFRPARLIPSP